MAHKVGLGADRTPCARCFLLRASTSRRDGDADLDCETKLSASAASRLAGTSPRSAHHQIPSPSTRFAPPFTGGGGAKGLDDHRRPALELDAGQTVDADHLDQGADLGLGAA
jgi:hypothetical protein